MGALALLSNKYVLGGIGALALVITFTFWVSSVKRTAYKKGITDTTASYEQAKADAKVRIDVMVKEYSDGEDDIKEIVRIETVEVVRIDTKAEADNVNLRLALRDLQKEYDNVPITFNNCDTDNVSIERRMRHDKIDNILQGINKAGRIGQTDNG